MSSDLPKNPLQDRNENRRVQPSASHNVAGSSERAPEGSSESLRIQNRNVPFNPLHAPGIINDELTILAHCRLILHALNGDEIGMVTTIQRITGIGNGLPYDDMVTVVEGEGINSTHSGAVREFIATLPPTRIEYGIQSGTRKATAFAAVELLPGRVFVAVRHDYGEGADRSTAWVEETLLVRQINHGYSVMALDSILPEPHRRRYLESAADRTARAQ